MKLIRKIYTSSKRQAERELRKRRRQEMRQAITAARAAAMESGLSTPEPESDSEPEPEPIREVGEHRPRELKYKFTITGGIFVGHHTWEHLLWCYH